MQKDLDDKSKLCIPFILHCFHYHRSKGSGEKETSPIFLGINGVQGAGKTSLVRHRLLIAFRIWSHSPEAYNAPRLLTLILFLDFLVQIDEGNVCSSPCSVALALYAFPHSSFGYLLIVRVFLILKSLSLVDDLTVT